MNSVLLILSLHYSVSLKARHHYYRMLNVTYVPQAVALLHGRNIWVKIAVLRNRRREQHNPRFWARDIFRRRRRRKNMSRVFFSPYGEKLFWSPFFRIRRVVIFIFEAHFLLKTNLSSKYITVGCCKAVMCDNDSKLLLLQ